MPAYIILILLILFLVIVVLWAFIIYTKKKIAKHDEQIEEITQKKNTPSNQELSKRITELKNDVDNKLSENTALIKSSFETIKNGIDSISKSYKDKSEIQNELMRALTIDYKSVNNKINAVNDSVTKINTTLGIFSATEELNALKKVIRERGNPNERK